jgi:LytS/YehU family sensor histidine kinase
MPQDDLHSDNNLLNSFKAFMGSHFALNVINSIQSDVILKDNTSAFSTLQLYSRLYKTSVRHSNEQWVLLSDEIELLKDYLSLEQIRFSEYRVPSIREIHVDEYTKVPSFIYQSLVENGLLLSLSDKNNHLKIVITDSEESTILAVSLEPRSSEHIHKKVESKVQLALKRLEVMKEYGLSYQLEWNKDNLMQLTYFKQ